MVRKFIGVAAAFAFVAAFIVSAPAEAGDFADLELLVDVSIDADSTAATKVNQGDTTLAVPSVGDTINIEVFLVDAGGLGTFTYNLVFDNTDNAFADGDGEGGLDTDGNPVDADDKFVILDQDGAVATFGGTAELNVSAVNFGPTGPFDSTIPANDFVTTVSIYVQGTVSDGDQIKLAGGSEGTLFGGDGDAVNVARAVITFEAPKVPTIAADKDRVEIETGGESELVTVTATNFTATTITWTVTQTSGTATVSILDSDGAAATSPVSTGTTIQLKGSGTGSAAVDVTAAADSESAGPVSVLFEKATPVALASFGAGLAEDRVVLNWATGSQTNNAGWWIERSLDGETYEVVGEFVAGAGTSDALLSYSFEDGKLPTAEMVYYRLKQVDLDGTVRFSDPLGVALGARFEPVPTDFAVNAYPNPFNPSTTVSYDLPVDAAVTIVIYDAVGQEVRRLVSDQKSAGRYKVQWDARDNLGHAVGSGVYIASVKAGSWSASQKMLLLK
jgi:hypothetical protein